MTSADRPVDELGYEDARDELVDVVRTLEQGGLNLDASLALWERGEKLAARCEHHLDGARRRIEAVLDGGGDGEKPAGHGSQHGPEEQAVPRDDDAQRSPNGHDRPMR